MLRQSFLPPSRGILTMTQILATLQQNGAYSCSSLSSFVNQIRYQNSHVVNLRRMFPLCQGFCLIPQKSEGQLTRGHVILAYAAVLKWIFSRRCAVLIEGPLGNCYTGAVTFLTTLGKLTLEGGWVTQKGEANYRHSNTWSHCDIPSAFYLIFHC